MKKIIIISLLFQLATMLAHTKPGFIKNNIEGIATATGSIKYLDIPARVEDAIEGSEFADQITGLSLKDREIAIVNEILAGNVPSFSRKLRPIVISQTIGSENYELTFYSTCDYMAIGSDNDYLYVPMTPSTAQHLANQLDCSLPTKKIVDVVYAESGIKLRPQPIPPSDKMTTVPVFYQHTDSIKTLFSYIFYNRSADSIIAGHKKDIIISNKIYSSDRNYERVVIYGWHRLNGNAIQPVYNGHNAEYADYSHGVRLISNIVLLNNDSTTVRSILADQQLSRLLSSEGVINKPYYPASDIFTSIKTGLNTPNQYKLYQNYPNPFNPSTTIKFSIAEAGHVSVHIYNLLSQLVETLTNKYYYAGIHSVIFNASSVDRQLASGVYIYRITAGSFVKSQRMLLLK